MKHFDVARPHFTIQLSTGLPGNCFRLDSIYAIGVSQGNGMGLRQSDGKRSDENPDNKHLFFLLKNEHRDPKLEQKALNTDYLRPLIEVEHYRKEQLLFFREKDFEDLIAGLKKMIKHRKTKSRTR